MNHLPTDPAHDRASLPATAKRATLVHASAATRVIATLAVIAALWWGQRFLIPLTAGIMLAVLIMPLVVRLQTVLHSTVAATVFTLAAFMGTLTAGAMVFGTQLVRVGERVPEMISMAAQQLTEREPGADSVLTRARDALQQLDRATDRVIAGKPLVRPGRRAVVVQPVLTLAAAPNNNITEGATVALKVTAVSGSGLLLSFAGQISIIFFIAFFVLSGGLPPRLSHKKFACLSISSKSENESANLSMAA